MFPCFNLFPYPSKVERNVNCDEPVTVNLKAKNNTDKPLPLAAAVRAHVIRYNGVKIASLDEQRMERDEVVAHGGR